MIGPFLTKLQIEGIYPEGAVLKLQREKISLFNVRKTKKKVIELCIERKNLKKVFTILNDSCYNIVKFERFGISRFFACCQRRVGVFIGICLFALLCTLSDLFVLRIEVIGTGNYYRREVLSLLEENGVGVGKRFSDKIVTTVTAQILALDDVGFCSLKKSGSVLWVEVQTTSPSELCQRESLYSPATGTVYDLTVLRGTVQTSEGDAVEKGQLLVGLDTAQEIVMASVRVLCTFTANVNETSAEKAIAYCLLGIESENNGEILTQNVTPTNEGFLVNITYLVTKSVNM